MGDVSIIFPHQLFSDHPVIRNDVPVYLVEEDLFFRQYAFHKQKLAFQRAGMQAYTGYLEKSGCPVNYIESGDPLSDIRALAEYVTTKGAKRVLYADPVDDWLEQRLTNAAASQGLETRRFESPMFLNTTGNTKAFFTTEKQKFSQTEFYIQQRKQRNVLLLPDGKPVGGKWSFDADNRKKYPKNKIPPVVSFPNSDKYFHEAIAYVEKHFADNPGCINTDTIYPHTHQAAEKWLHEFLEKRFDAFGPYEDAIVAEKVILHHSVLTPMLNVGLLTPDRVLKEVVRFAEKKDIPLNSTEGFVRQLMGWREFIRGMYVHYGRKQRTTNFWGFTRKIPPSFYDGTTGILPLDITIQKVLKHAYCHHIERLMIIGNFMLLCEFDPDEVYHWFMELFIDAFDWVMVPNVYGMSQFADGGLMATKPYISGSNYIMKMSDHKPGDWQLVWDALFWRFMHVHRSFFTQNPRLGMLVKTFDKMTEEKRQKLLHTAEQFLSKLDE